MSALSLLWILTGFLLSLLWIFWLYILPPSSFPGVASMRREEMSTARLCRSRYKGQMAARPLSSVILEEAAVDLTRQELLLPAAALTSAATTLR